MSKTMTRLRFARLPVLACGLAALLSMPAQAAPLDPFVCGQLQLKHDGLRREGVEADMALGPAAAKVSLPPERLARIGEYIELEEQLNFRCGLAKLRTVLPTTVEGGEEEVPAPGEATAEGTPGALPLPQKAPRAVKGAAVTGTKAAERPKAPAAPVKRKPAVAKAKDAPETAAKPPPKRPAKDGATRKAAQKKPAGKADDAYRPPPQPAARSETPPAATKQ